MLTPKHSEKNLVEKLVEELSNIYARKMNRYKFKYQKVFSASFYKQNEDDQKIDLIEWYIIFVFNQNLTESDIDNVIVWSHL